MSDTNAMARAGFNAGWAAAHLSLAEIADQQGLAKFARWMRERAMKPDGVEVVEEPAPAEPRK